MAILKMKKMRELSEKERKEKLTELRLEVSKDMAAAEVGGTVKSPGRIKEIRRTIARLMTIENEQQRKKKKNQQARNGARIK